MLRQPRIANVNSIYFAYGSNMSAAQMRHRCPGARSLGPALLKHFRLAFDRYSARRGGYVADIVEAPGHDVWGVAWEVTPAHLESLDHHEGVAAAAYHRESVTIGLRGGEERPAIAYRVLIPAAEGSPSAPYLAAIISGAEEHGLPADYLAYLRSIVPTTPAD